MTTYIGYLSVLGFIGTTLMTVGSFCSCDRNMRRLMIAGGSIWLVHNVILWTPVGVLLEVVFVTSGLVGYYRHYIRGVLQTDS